jgi:hypothetical protein
LTFNVILDIIMSCGKRTRLGWRYIGNMPDEFWIAATAILSLIGFLCGYKIKEDTIRWTRGTSRELDEEEIEMMDKAFEHFDDAMSSANKAFDKMRSIPRKRRKDQ